MDRTTPKDQIPEETREVRGYCALCRSRCGCISEVEDGRLVAVRPDPGHPTGTALCAKGKAAPELVHHPERLTHPMRRTAPKGAADPGWERISWDEALDYTAAGLTRLAGENGPESVAFAVTTPSGTGISDSIQWIERLIRAYGSPNNIYGTEICNWHKDFAHAYTFGAGVGSPDLPKTGCIILWGHNPSTAWLAMAQGVAGARKRGAKVIVIDPRRVAAAVKADEWLRVRPGTDGLLALAIAGVMVRNGWYDTGFVRDWTNAPLLVRLDDSRLLTGADMAEGGRDDVYFAWNTRAGKPARYESATRRYDSETEALALDGEVTVETAAGPVQCVPVFAQYAALVSEVPLERVEERTGVPAAQIEATAKLIWESRPVAYHAWSGVGQQTNATQTERAIATLYALTGSYDAPGGNVNFAKAPVADVSGWDLMPETQKPKALGFEARPLGPARHHWITSGDFYDAALTGKPYPVRGLVGFGANLLVSHGGPVRGHEALKALDFCVYADMFMTPTAALADVVLPVATPWERSAIRAFFEPGAAAAAHLQFRDAVLEPIGESRSDAWIVFELAKRLGLADRFWGGDLEAGYRAMLDPTGISLDDLRACPEGIAVDVKTEYRKYRESGFATPTGKAEFWSETFRRHGQSPLPEYVPSLAGAEHRAGETGAFPLLLTSAKTPLFCHSQHRNIPSLRKIVPHPKVELHPDAARSRNIEDGDWVDLRTPHGQVRMVAAFNEWLDPGVVAAQHGWWQACTALDLPGYDVLAPDGANYNALIPDAEFDPVSGSVPHRGTICEIARTEAPG